MSYNILDTVPDKLVETLNEIDSKAEENSVEDVKVNGTSVISNKIANVTVPTKTSDITNDSNYQTGTQVSSAISTATSNLVDISTSQTISGSKTFTNSITVKNPTDQMGVTPSTDQETYITFEDKNGNQEGQFYFCHDTNDTTQFALILNGSRSGISCVFLEKGSGDWYYYPSSNNGMVFGHDTNGSVSTMDKQWKRIYGQTIYQNGKQVANKEELPTKTSDLTNDSNFTTKTYVDGLVGNVETLLQALR